MGRMNDGGERVGRAESFVGIVVVVHAADIDGGSIEDRSQAVDVAVATTVSTLVSQPVDAFKGALVVLAAALFATDGLQFLNKVRLQALDKGACEGSVWRLGVDAFHGPSIARHSSHSVRGKPRNALSKKPDKPPKCIRIVFV